MRGQASLEYIFTYGLAFLALLITLGAISYLDVFNLSNIRSSECSLPSGMECLDYVLSVANAGGDAGVLNPLPSPALDVPYVRMIVYNSYGVNLTVVNATVTLEQVLVNSSCAIVPASDGLQWAVGTNKTFWCPIPPAEFHARNYYNGLLTMQFNQSGGSYTHQTLGLLAMTAQ
jgi:hypothetical protein